MDPISYPRVFQAEKRLYKARAAHRKALLLRHRDVEETRKPLAEHVRLALEASNSIGYIGDPAKGETSCV